MNKILIAPSILSADFSRIGEEIKNVTECGADVIHLDVMDGNFVKNITFGPKFVKDSRKYSQAIFDAHLMIESPWKYIEKFAEAGSDIITVHYEACRERLSDTLKAIKSLGVKCGAAINPDTDVSVLENVAEDCDMFLLMSVFPGFGGQKFIPETIEKLKLASRLIGRTGKEILLEIDGGITAENVSHVKNAGANVIVAGSTVFKEADKRAIIERLRNS